MLLRGLFVNIAKGRKVFSIKSNRRRNDMHRSCTEHPAHHVCPVVFVHSSGSVVLVHVAAFTHLSCILARKRAKVEMLCAVLPAMPLHKHMSQMSGRKEMGHGALFHGTSCDSNV